MKTKIYRVQGRFKNGDYNQVFTKEMKAVNEEDIYSSIYSKFGSKHRIKRENIKITKIEEISAEDLTDPIVKELC